MDVGGASVNDVGLLSLNEGKGTSWETWGEGGVKGQPTMLNLIVVG